MYNLDLLFHCVLIMIMMTTSYQRVQKCNIFTLGWSSKTQGNSLSLPVLCQSTDLVKLRADDHTGEILNMGNIRIKDR